tara:strand:+ start:714 stop:1403 length:690 start_codon:yes stop_codon:yes gene_type:complete
MAIKAWEGQSEINGKDIVLAIGAEKRKSRNPKTGPMVQVAAFVKDVSPLEAQKTGADEATCGGCPLRPKLHKEAKSKNEEVSKYPCYVKTFRKLAQWTAINKREVDYAGALSALSGRAVRFGEYGNMSSVPREVIEPLMQATNNHTLYEHEWEKPENQWLNLYAMASVHSLEERARAKELGFRTFRVGDDPQEGEVFCPNHTHNIQCIDCKLCSGNKCGAKDVVNPSHR